MKVIEPGHIYKFQNLDGDLPNVLTFVNREPGHEHAGTQTQEVLRALIDRTRHCDNCLRWEGNDLIVHYMQMALVLFEARALEMKVRKGQLDPEMIATSIDGHFKLTLDQPEGTNNPNPQAIRPDIPKCQYKEYP